MRKPLRHLALLCALLAVGAAAAEDDPETALRGTVDRVVAVLRDATLADAAKRTAVKRVIDERFDYGLMASRVLATNWRRATEAQRAQFTELFEALLADTYWGRISRYRNEEIRFLPTAPPDRGYATVRTVILTTGADVPVDYKLARKDGEWLVYDVVIEQASLVRNYRGEYQQIVQRDGIDGLLRRLQAPPAQPRSGL
jgi:phospholipid transport system substrate-binding protein